MEKGEQASALAEALSGNISFQPSRPCCGYLESGEGVCIIVELAEFEHERECHSLCLKGNQLLLIGTSENLQY